MTTEAFGYSGVLAPHTVIYKALRTLLRNNQQSIFAIKNKCALFCAIKIAE